MLRSAASFLEQKNVGFQDSSLEQKILVVSLMEFILQIMAHVEYVISETYSNPCTHLGLIISICITSVSQLQANRISSFHEIISKMS